MKGLKILTCFTVSLAVAVAVLLLVSVGVFPGVSRVDAAAERQSAANTVVEDAVSASRMCAVPERPVKGAETAPETQESAGLQEYASEYETAAEGAPDAEFEAFEEAWTEGEPAEELTEAETWQEDDAGYYYEEPDWTGEDYWEEPSYEEPSYEEPSYEEPTTNVPDPVLDGGLTEGNRIAAQIAAYAETFVGVLPYNWAHHSLDPDEGADCSGFTHALYEAFGYYWLSYNDYGQSQQGRSVLYEEWLPGDIMCYYGHVGIYVGNGLMVHCPEPGRYVEYGSATYTQPFDVRRMVE